MNEGESLSLEEANAQQANAKFDDEIEASFVITEEDTESVSTQSLE